MSKTLHFKEEQLWNFEFAFQLKYVVYRIALQRSTDNFASVAKWGFINLQEKRKKETLADLAG
jgi:hypothetical protein